MEAQTTVYLTLLLLCPAGYITLWQRMFEEITTIPVFPGIHEVLVLLKDTLLR
jgi:hypothetical protein